MGANGVWHKRGVAHTNRELGAVALGVERQGQSSLQLI